MPLFIDVAAQCAPSPSPAIAATVSNPSWNVYGGERPAGMVIFSKQ
jgi:hypothetical protein